MSSFYEYLNKQNHPKCYTEDAMPAPWKHPDGSPCYAKSKKSCPIMREEMEKDDADDVSGPDLGSETEERHYNELVDTLEQIRTLVPGFQDLTFSNLESAYQYVDEQINAWKQHGEIMQGTRQKRNEIFAQHPDAMYESFSLDNGEKITDEESKDKYGVTFHTTRTEAKSDEEYDTNVARFSDILQAKPQVGVYEGECEISFNCPSVVLAAAAMVRCEQKAIFGNAYSLLSKNEDDFGIDIENYTFDDQENALEHSKKEDARWYKHKQEHQSEHQSTETEALNK